MIVWIFNPYGNLPDEGWSPYRSTSLAEALVARGHEVVWWVSDFEHRSKKPRVSGSIDYGSGFRAMVIPASRYSRHISFARVRYERSYARNLLWAVNNTSHRPDLIIHGEPALCFSDISIQAVRACGAPLVIDVIDLWPELFEVCVPTLLRPILRPLMRPLRRRRAAFFRAANGFLAVATDYLALAQSAAPSVPGRVVYLGTDVSKFTSSPIHRKAYSNFSTSKRPGEKWCIYVGTLGRNYDVGTVLAAAPILQKIGVRILIAGDGDLRSNVEAAHNDGKVHFLGRLTFEKLLEVYPHCDVALACYAQGSTVSMPFKAFDYLAAGLPIVTSLRRDLGGFVTNLGIGALYQSGNVDSLVRCVLALTCDDKKRSTSAAAARKLGATMDYSVQYCRAAEFLEKVATRHPKNQDAA